MSENQTAPEPMVSAAAARRQLAACGEDMAAMQAEIERLRRIEKAARNLISAHGYGDDNWAETARTYLIWSHEHGAWWGPDECGYVQALSKAGRYTHADALRICARSLPGTSRDLRAFPELPVREDDILMVRDRFVGQFPSEAEVLG